MKTIIKYITILFLGIGLIPAGNAQAEGSSIVSDNLLAITLTIAAIVCILVLLVLLVLLRVLQTFLNKQAKDKYEAAVARGEKPQPVVEESIFSRFMKDMTDAVPLEEEDSVLTDHEYDGIRELDNNLPPWWRYMFYLTIVFSVVYLGHYHILGTGPSSAEEYDLEVAEATAQIEAYQAALGDAIDETNVTFSDDPAVLAEGKEFYDKLCVACHAADGGGGVGPNFADNYWIHGGTIGDVFRTIKDGVPSKGMISWKSQLTPAQMQAVSSYVLTFQGTTPANPKEPQGDLAE